MIGDIGRLVLAMLWRFDRGTRLRAEQMMLRARLDEIQALIRELEGREEGLLVLFNDAVREYKNELRVGTSPLASVAAPMRRLRSMRRTS